jgi:hypothetical protein
MSKVMNIKIVLSFILLLSVPIFSQTETLNIAPDSRIWVGTGAVISNFENGGASGGFGGDLNFATGGKLYKARCMYVKEVTFILFEGEPPVSSLWESGLLFGLISPKWKKRLSIAAGISYVGGTKVLENYDEVNSQDAIKDISTIGLPVEVQVLFSFDREVGAGLTVFGDLNSENSFGGITISLIMGKLR